jgi:hypothetical protein
MGVSGNGNAVGLHNHIYRTPKEMIFYSCFRVFSYVLGQCGISRQRDKRVIEPGRWKLRAFGSFRDAHMIDSHEWIIERLLRTLFTTRIERLF